MRDSLVCEVTGKSFASWGLLSVNIALSLSFLSCSLYVVASFLCVCVCGGGA
jgi:hypothetical protein